MMTTEHEEKPANKSTAKPEKKNRSKAKDVDSSAFSLIDASQVDQDVEEQDIRSDE